MLENYKKWLQHPVAQEEAKDSVTRHLIRLPGVSFLTNNPVEPYSSDRQKAYAFSDREIALIDSKLATFKKSVNGGLTNDRDA